MLIPSGRLAAFMEGFARVISREARRQEEEKSSSIQMFGRNEGARLLSVFLSSAPYGFRTAAKISEVKETSNEYRHSESVARRRPIELRFPLPRCFLCLIAVSRRHRRCVY